nr:MAG TPA: hypothetical protein [Bacteriophage sp.]
MRTSMYTSTHIHLHTYAQYVRLYAPVLPYTCAPVLPYTYAPVLLYTCARRVAYMRRTLIIYTSRV